jgi:uncharacterized coiled-coil protein SlyX
MAFDPTKPVAGAEIDANELRDQYNGLNDTITAQQAQITDLQNQVASLAAQLATVTATIVANSAGPVTMVNPVSGSVSNPPKQVEVEDIQDTLNFLIQKLQRA